MAEGEERTGGGGDDKKGKYPVGFRFKPTDEELVEFYLLPKLQGRPTVPNDAIIEADVYECDPEILINQKYKDRGETDWYFLSPRNRKYPGGDRPSRRTADDRGRWKPSTGQSEPGKKKEKSEQGTERLCKGSMIRFRENTLAYHVGPSKDETKTKWLMHELTVPEYEIKRDSGRPAGNSMLLDRYVMCRIYKSPLTKWIKFEEGGSSSAREEAGSSSQPGSGPVAAETGQGTAAPTLSSKEAGKRPAVEQQPLSHATAPKRAALPTPLPRPPAPMHDNRGGGMRVSLGVGTAAGYHGVPGQQAQIPWPPVMCNSLQGPVRRPQSMHNGRTVTYNVHAPVQGQPGSRPCQTPRAATAAHSSLGQTMVMRPPFGFETKMTIRPPKNQAAGQPVPPPPAPQPPLKLEKREMDDANRHRVLTRLLAELKTEEARQLGASCAAQQQRPAGSWQPQQPCFDAGVNHPARANAMVPRPQHSAARNCYPCIIGGQQQQQQQQQQLGSATQPASVACGAAAPSEATPASDSASNQGSGKGGRDNNAEQLFADLAISKNMTPEWD